MKVYIIGPSGAGKTTLAEKISREQGLPVFHTDTFVYKAKKLYTKKTEVITHLNNEIDELLRNNGNWIIEGRHLFNDALAQADKIIWLDIPFWLALLRQWKRFFKDKQEYEKGYLNQIRFSFDILKDQYFGKYDKTRVNDPLYSHNKKIKSFSGKLSIVIFRKDILCSKY